HRPLVGLHTPATWHWSRAVQSTGFDPTQAPAMQRSVCVHASPSLQEVLSAWFAPFWLQVPEPLHRAALQSLGVVSAHEAVEGLKQLPAVSLQVLLHSPPVVQGLPACTVQPPVASQASAPLQNRPSLHIVAGG